MRWIEQTRRQWMRVAILAAAVLWFGPETVWAETPVSAAAVGGPSISRQHTEVIDGQRIKYVSSVESTNVAGPDGTPWAQFVSIAYTRLPNDAHRPVAFLFNGGPGASSAFLHLVALGPVRLQFPRDPTTQNAQLHMMANDYSLLDVADLVFIDPPETGLSRSLPGDTKHSFASIEGDAQLVGAFIRAWTANNRRELSPKFLIGESYGATRAALVADQLAAAQSPVFFNGLVLVSQLLTVDDLGQRPMNAQGYATYLPSMAAVAWYHSKAARTGGFDFFMARVRAFAFDEYLPALMLGDELPHTRAAEVADKLSDYTGIPAAFLLDRGLKLTTTQFRHRLLPEKLVGDYDGRYVAAASSNAKEPASAISEDPNDPARLVTNDVVGRALTTYLENEVGVADTSEYRLMDDKLGKIWDFGNKFRKPASTWLMEATTRNPRMHLLLASGYHDLVAPFTGSQFLLSQLGMNSGRGEFRGYSGGHMFYTDPQSLAAFSRDLHRFIAESLTPKG